MKRDFFSVTFCNFVIGVSLSSPHPHYRSPLLSVACFKATCICLQSTDLQHRKSSSIKPRIMTRTVWPIDCQQNMLWHLHLDQIITLTAPEV